MPGAESAPSQVAASPPTVAVTAASYKPVRSVVDAVVARAPAVVKSVTPYVNSYVTPVYNKVTPYVPASVMSAANAATSKVLSYAPAANAAVNAGVDAVDKRVNSVVDYIHSKEASLPTLPAVAIPVQWVATVNSALQPLLSKDALVDLRAKISNFYTVSLNTLLELKEKNNTSVKREEFIRELRGKLAHQWDERLQKPAEELYEKSRTIVLTRVDAVAKSEYVATLRAQLGERWEAAVQEVYHKRLESSAKLIYQTALAYYLSLYQKGGEQAASLANYLQGLKAHLGTYPQYTEKVEPLLKQAYDTIKAVVAKLPLLTKATPTTEQANAASDASATLAMGQAAAAH